ncbi:MAG: hypothetical protein M3O93_01475 [Chloroflexota bacterium]|nr:hypothetical protein [Chloroflexota bacterium]
MLIIKSLGKRFQVTAGIAAAMLLAAAVASPATAHRVVGARDASWSEHARLASIHQSQSEPVEQADADETEPADQTDETEPADQTDETEPADQADENEQGDENDQGDQADEDDQGEQADENEPADQADENDQADQADEGGSDGGSSSDD